MNIEERLQKLENEISKLQKEVQSLRMYIVELNRKISSYHTFNKNNYERILKELRRCRNE